MTEQPIALAAPEQGEEVQRAELYGLLARLWLAPPDAALREQFAVAVTEAPQAGGLLEPTWQALVAALRAASVADAEAEFDALFQGVSKPEITLYGSYYLAGAVNAQPLATLRAELAELGLTREPGGDNEDHIAFVFEVMRYLIAGDDIAVCNLERQRRFFRAHVQPWVGAMCDALERHPTARLYVALAAFTRAFVEIETQAFDLVE